jgi:putative transposase
MTNKQTPVTGVAERSLVEAGKTPVVLPEALVAGLDELTAQFAEHMGEDLMAESVAIGLDVLDQMMRGEVALLAGPKGRHDPDRTHVRRGS